MASSSRWLLLHLPTTAGTIVALIVAILAWYWSSRSSRSSSTIISGWNRTYDPALGVGEDLCTIERVPEAEMTPERFQTDYWRQKPVILLRVPGTNREIHQRTHKDALVRSSGDAMIRLATYESYAFREKEIKGSFADYLQDLKPVSPNTTSNTTFAFGADPYGVGDYYAVPDVISSLRDELNLEWHYMVAVAASGAGLAMHWHADVFAETLQGRRRWFLSPPERSLPFNPRATSAEWLQQVRPHIQNMSGAFTECTIGTDEAIYVPADWFHSTCSLGEAVSITTSFAETFRKDFRQQRRDLGPGFTEHIQMLDSLGANDFNGAIRHGELLAKQRPESFVPFGWLGVIYTLAAQNAGTSTTPERITDLLDSARRSSLRCVQLNPHYAPCHVWLAKQCRALSLVCEHCDPERSRQLAQDAADARRAAASLTHIDDSEILDPRWRPRAREVEF